MRAATIGWTKTPTFAKNRRSRWAYSSQLSADARVGSHPMAPALPYHFLADAVLGLHFAIVSFVVGGLVLVLVGNALHWRWVNGWWFRLTHAGAIVVIVAQVWLGRVCPLTSLESWLRVRAGSPSYSESFIEHWVHRLLYYELPSWVFTVAYTVFGLLVLAAWLYFPPERGKPS